MRIDAWFGVFFKRRNRIFCAGNPRGGGAFLADNHAGLSRFDGDETAASFAGANGATAAENLTPQEQLLAGTLELDPENDPVICTTESGLEIKYAQATIDNNYYGPGTAGEISSPSGLSGYAYLSMGTYDNKPINWIIIGYNRPSTTVTMTWSGNFALAFSKYLADPMAYGSFAGSLETTSDAGSIISSASSNGIIWAYKALTIALDYSSAQNNTSELSEGEFLVISADTLGSTIFHGSSNIYYKNSSTYSTLWSRMQALYYPNKSNSAGFTASEATLIVPKTLTTAGSNSSTEYLFPLGTIKRASTESFAVENYLSNNANCKIESKWWLRSARKAHTDCTYRVRIDGSIYNQDYGNYDDLGIVDSTCGIRPAMVLKIT